MLHDKTLKHPKLVLFDFDGTITSRDTFIEFLKFYTGISRFAFGMTLLAPVLALYAMKLIPNWKAKELVLRFFLGGATASYVSAKSEEFSQKILPQLIRPGALEEIRAHQASGATVAVVSASAEQWVEPWCRANQILCISTQLEVSNGIITGRLCGANCYGPEKVRRIQKEFTLDRYQEIIAYGDSHGDREMFAIAHRHYFKPFRETLRQTTGTA